MNFALARYCASPGGVKGGSGLGWPPRSSGFTSPFGCMNGAGSQIPIKLCESKAPALASVFAPLERSVWAPATAKKASAAAKATTEPKNQFRILELLSTQAVRGRFRFEIVQLIFQ